MTRTGSGRGVPQVEGASHRIADVTGVGANLVHALQHARGLIASPEDVRGLGQPLQILDRQRKPAVDRLECVARVHPRLPAVALPRPLQLRDHVHGASRVHSTPAAEGGEFAAAADAGLAVDRLEVVVDRVL